MLAICWPYAGHMVVLEGLHVPLSLPCAPRPGAAQIQIGYNVIQAPCTIVIAMCAAPGRGANSNS
eukprot:3163232-Karenia_brevis.AAC.1